MAEDKSDLHEFMRRWWEDRSPPIGVLGEGETLQEQLRLALDRLSTAEAAYRSAERYFSSPTAENKQVFLYWLEETKLTDGDKEFIRRQIAND